jgi:hypothetical protein
VDVAGYFGFLEILKNKKNNYKKKRVTDWWDLKIGWLM